MQKGLTSIIVLVGLLIVAALVSGGFYILKQTPTPKACTEEAKICPDGTSVGRTGPNCDFAPCPKSSPTPTDETATWKTYNPSSNWTIKYPSNWFTFSLDPNPVTGAREYQFSNKSFLPNNDKDMIGIIVRHWMQDTVLFNLLKKLQPGEEIKKDERIYTKITDLTIGGMSAIKYTENRSAMPAILLLNKNEYFGDQVFNFILTTGSVETFRKNENIFDQIISTFKITFKTLPASSGSGICGTVTYVPGAKGFSPGGISTKLEIFTKKDNTFITSTRSGEDGRYQVSLPQGEYKVVVTEYQITNFVTVEREPCSNLDIRINAP